MNITHDRENDTITTNQMDYMEDVMDHFGMSYKPTCTPGMGPELYLNQLEEKWLCDNDKARYQFVTGAIKYLGQVSHYDSLFDVTWLARASPKPSKAQMAEARHLFRYMAGL